MSLVVRVTRVCDKQYIDTETKRNQTFVLAHFCILFYVVTSLYCPLFTEYQF